MGRQDKGTMGPSDEGIPLRAPRKISGRGGQHGRTIPPVPLPLLLSCSSTFHFSLLTAPPLPISHLPISPSTRAPELNPEP